MIRKADCVGRLLSVCVLAACAGETQPPKTVTSDARAQRWSAAQRDTLLRYGREDQLGRDQITVAITAQDTATLFAMLRADSARSRWVRAAVARAGWPTRRVAGDSTLDAAWTILQHSPDTAWQASALPELEELGRRGEIEQQEIALLTDRVLTHRGLPQRYGTQFEPKDGRLVAAPIEDQAGLDARRGRMGLPPMAEYVRKLSEVYKLPADWPPRP